MSYLQPLRPIARAAACVCAAGASAQTEPALTPEDVRGSWLLGLNAAFISADLTILSTELDLPEGVRFEDVTLDISEVSVTSQQTGASVSHFLLPFLEVSGLVGFATTSTDTDLSLTARPDFGLGLVDDPITIGFASEADVSGYTYGAGAAIYAPLGQPGGRPLVLRNSVSWSASRFDGDQVSTDTLSGASTLVYLADIGGADHIFTLGGAYNRVDRVSERSATTPFGVAELRLTQELSDPWSVQIGAARRFTPRLSAGYALVHNIDGANSHVLRLTFAP